MVLMKNIILSVLFILAVAVFAAGVAGCFLLLQEKREFNKNRKREDNSQSNAKRWKREKIVNVALCVAGFVILFVCCVTGIVWKPSQTGGSIWNNSNMTMTNDEDVETISREFKEPHQNEKSTKWERILEESLDYTIFTENISLTDYKSYNGNMLLAQDGTASVEKIHSLYENYADYLTTESAYTLTQINEYIDGQAGKGNVSAEIHKAEVVLYAGDIKGKEGYISRESVCQAGRAAQEVVDCLCRDSEADVKEIILYAALAKEYYAYAMTMPVGDMESVNRYNEYILYRMGMLYDKLAEYDILKEYQEHFLLEAASLYALSSTTGMGREGIKQNHIYYVDYYQGRVLYYLYNMGRSGEGEDAKACIKEFMRIMDEIPPEFQLRNVEENCIFILTMLNGE